jgi:hypothetical protein
MARQLTFANSDPVTGGRPTVDGFTGLHDLLEDGVIIAEGDEPGYDLGGRVTFDGGGGLSPAVIQCVRDVTQDFLYLSFLVRQDQSFDNNDLVVVCLRPDIGGTHDASTLRFDIFPVWTSETSGADIADTTNPLLPAGTPDPTLQVPPATPPATPIPSSHWHVRMGPTSSTSPATNAPFPPRRVSFYRGKTGGPPFWENPTAILPRGTEVKVASWSPDVPSGAAPDRCWSIELKIPRTLAVGGTPSSVTLNPQFGVYVNMVRVSVGGTSPPIGFQANTQYIWPDPSATISGTLGVNTNIDPTKYGEGYIPALDTPQGAHLAAGVKFRYDSLGVPLVGARLSTAPSNSPPGEVIDRTKDNVLVAQVENTGTRPAEDAPNVKADFHFANWGLGPSSPQPTNAFPAWAPASGASVPTAAQNINHGQQVELTANWLQANIPSQFAPPHDHQCVFVMLDSTSGVNFVQDSVRRNMNFIPLSEQRRPAEISGKGYPPPASGSHHRFALVVNARRLRQFERPREQPPGEIGVAGSSKGTAVVWQWIVSGFRRLDESLTIDGTTYETWEPAPGAFGYIARHDKPDDVLTYDLSGPGLRKLIDGVYELRVPHDGTVTLDTVVTAAPPKKKPKGCLGWVLAILLAIVAFFRKLFK